MPLDQDYEKAKNDIEKLRREQGYMPVSAHLDELRARILRSLGWIAFFATLSLIFYSQVWRFIMGPVGELILKARAPGMPAVKLMTTRLGDNFVIEFKILLLAGFILAFPLVLRELWAFVTPALSARLRQRGSAILLASVLLFWGGVVFARLITWKTVTEFLVFQWLPPELEIAPGEKIRPEIYLSVADYLSFFTGFHLAFGLSFQLPVVAVVLGSLGILSSAFFWRYWRHAVVLLCIFSIIVMPPDVVAMLALMLPLVGLYFLSGLLVMLIERRQLPR
ncbi:MAG: twin-arginine translocase subunit TatC [Leptospiraceae bacterium]|nr:twin-arginine translocase subunit TatC [Leptospiraceae bacterium]